MEYRFSLIKRNGIVMIWFGSANQSDKAPENNPKIPQVVRGSPYE